MSTVGVDVSPLFLLAVQIVSSFVVFGLFATIVVAPYLRALPRDRARMWLLSVHTMRYVPLGMLAPGQTDHDVPRTVAHAIAWGDFASAVLAVVALAALHLRIRSAEAWTRLFAVVSSIDIVVALVLGLGSGVYEHSLGVSWYVLTLYVPLVCVAHAMLVAMLVRGTGGRVRDRS